MTSHSQCRKQWKQLRSSMIYSKLREKVNIYFNIIFLESHGTDGTISTETENEVTLIKDDEIEKLEELLRKKKADKEFIETKYMPLVEFICDVIKEEELDFKVVTKLVLSFLEQQ